MRLIDADALKAHYAWWDNDNKELFNEIVDVQPTVGVEPVVRCMNCIFRRKEDGWCSVFGCFIENEAFYCANGAVNYDEQEEKT